MAGSSWLLPLDVCGSELPRTLAALSEGQKTSLKGAWGVAVALVQGSRASLAAPRAPADLLWQRELVLAAVPHHSSTHCPHPAPAPQPAALEGGARH